MKNRSTNRRSVTLLMVLLPLLLAFGYVATSSGPLAPVPVTVVEVEEQAITPALFGLGTVEVRYRYNLGPTVTGRLLSLGCDVGDRVNAGAVLGEMDPVDMDEIIAANQAAIQRATATVVATEAFVEDSTARSVYATSQVKRYKRLAVERNVSSEAAEAKEQEFQVAKSGLAAAEATLKAEQQALAMLRAEYEGLLRQRSNLRLIAPVDGVVVGRHIEPGSTVMAGQVVVEMIDPKSIWINVRFNQLQSDGLAKGLPATIAVRSRASQLAAGSVERIELLADSVTEEMLAKVVFEQLPVPIPPIGELAEVTVSLPQLDPGPVLPNAAIKRVNGVRGVWRVVGDSLKFTAVETGVSDLDGRVQITRGLKPGDLVVLYSKKELARKSRIKVVEQLVDDAS